MPGKRVFGKGAAALLAAVLVVVASGVTQAQGQLIASYSAFLSDRDHFNSQGIRLTTAAQIIRQDRANFHRYNLRDPGDGYEPLFASANNRAILENMVGKAPLSPADRGRIVNGAPTITVEIWGYGASIQSVTVYVH